MKIVCNNIRVWNVDLHQKKNLYSYNRSHMLSKHLALQKKTKKTIVTHSSVHKHQPGPLELQKIAITPPVKALY